MTASRDLTANAPVPLTDLPGIWAVASGLVNVFAVRLVDGTAVGRRLFVAQLPAGSTLVGLEQPADAEFTLLAVGGLDATIRPADTAEHVASWIRVLGERLRDPALGWGERTAALGGMTLDAGERLAAAGHDVLWAETVEGSIAGMAGQRADPGQPPLPVYPGAPITAATAARLNLMTTGQALARFGPPVIQPWHAAMLRRVAAESLLLASEDAAQITRNATASRAALRQGLLSLAGQAWPGGAGADAVGLDPDWRAVVRVAAAAGLAMPSPPAPPAAAPGSERLALLLEDTDLRRRQVLLTDRWWRRRHGPLLALRRDAGEAVALLPARRGYTLWDPRTDTAEPVTDEVAATIAPIAWMFYRSLPPHPLRLGDILATSRRGAGAAARWAALIAVLNGILALAPPAATAVLVDQAIPSSDRGQVAVLAIGLAAAAFGAACLRMAQSVALLQLEALLDINVQPALFDRLLRLPATFFRRFGAADLADRVMGIQKIREMLANSGLTGALAGLSAILSLGVMLACDVKLALVGLGAAAAMAAARGAAAAAQLRKERELARRRGLAENFVLQAVAGVAKLKAAAATGRAFGLWASLYATQRRNFVAAQKLANLQQVLNALLVPLALAGLFLVGASVAQDYATQAALAVPGQAAPGTFGLAAWAAFSTAFGQLTAGLNAVVTAIAGVLGIVPHYERARPVLAQLPDGGGAQRHPGVLNGAIELTAVTFAYGDAPPVLQDLSLAIKAGEFVAIVGPSGSGKSTLLRLLLGFEMPDRGDVLFDGRSTADLDMAAVRRQIGVVLQNGRLQPGSLLTNIGAGRTIGLEDAWHAARLAGLEVDIRDMPMGMHTVITDGGSTLSGGQRQRLMIARALGNKPRILLLDEATSALDNRTQSIVTETVAGLGLTRVVIAHRLSTIERVDRVLVIDRGRLVQSGRFEELMNTPGLFQDLARRQTL